MAETILTNVLNRKISIDELFQWLTSDNLEEIICPDIVQNGSTRADFVSYFLNYLREQSKSILPDSKQVVEKPTKKASYVPPNKVVANSKEAVAKNLQDSPYHGPLLQRSNGPSVHYNNYIPCQGGQPVFYPRTPPTPGQMSGRTAEQMHMYYSQSFDRSGPMSPRASDPGIIRNQLNSCSPLPNSMPYGMQTLVPNYRPGGQQIPQNQVCGNVGSVRSPQFPYQNNITGDAKLLGDTSSPYNSPNVSRSGFNPAINQAQMQFGNLNLTSSSGAFENSFSNVSGETGSPQRFDSSMRNGSSMAPFSPLSPLYANNVSIPCPKRAEKSLNEVSNSYDCSVNSSNSSKTSTPKNAMGSSQKAAKVPQDRSRCLGDFMTVEGSQGSKKSIKKQMRTQQWRKSQGDPNSPADATQSPTSSVKSKRRINPTRLDVSGGKESPGKEVFGVISRPSAANPKFVEAPSADKSHQEASFEVERGLLKLERQRQPKNESIPETINTEQKLPIKTKQESAVVPCIDLVENVEALNTLANLYSGILDHNLMTNPMTELYFLVTLLTSQYKTLKKKKKSTKSGTDANKSANSSVQLLESLKDDLGCAELTDEISSEIDAERSHNPDIELTEELTVQETKESSIPKKRTDEREICTEEYLGTAHNCVYFATMVLLNQQFLLSTLDRAALKLLCENHQINGFQPDLQKYLSEIYRVKCSQAKSVKQVDSRSLQMNVCFQVDTDNRETFPSATAFSLFRKQRDLFYDILRDWEDHHLKPDWSFQRALQNKINVLLTLHTDAVNYCHFAKLFVSQLLVSSIQSGQSEDPMDDESLSFLKSLKDVNPEKLIQLKGRLVTPLTSTGPVPAPVFPGVQEFYKEFILNATNWKFCVILETTFIHEILELNEAQFAGSEIEGTETTVDESTKQNFITCVSSLRLLAKFTSFTMSLPFHTATSSAEWIVKQIQLRGKVQPPLDLQGCLMDALIHRRLSLTVPWIVQYLSMLDTIALRLPYYMNIGEQLYCIYRTSSQLHSSNLMSAQTATLMMFTIGWLFELPNFPRELYTYWQMNYDAKKLRLSLSADEPAKGQNVRAIDVKTCKEFVKPNSALDKLDIIDDRVLYECCPFLAEFKILLISGNAVLGNTNANRHITPVSSQLSQPTFGAKTKNLQMQLEEAFFHGQPSSIRKTVDFVSERVASSCVKYICNSIIPSVKQRNMENFVKSNSDDIALAIKYYAKDEKEEDKKLQGSTPKTLSKAEKQSRSQLVEQLMSTLAMSIKEAVKKECEEKILEMCEDRTIKSIESLLADDALPTVKETCTAISRRLAKQRIDEWIELHVTEDLFLKNMIFELRKLVKEGAGEKTEKENRHNPEVPSPTEVIEMLRNSMWELLEKKGRWSELSVDDVTKTLTSLRQTLMERADLVHFPERSLYTMSVEFCLLLLTNRQDLFTMEIQRQFINIWKMNNANRVGDTEDLFVRIICPRNIRLLTHTTDKTTLRGFGRLLKGLLKEDLLSIEALSDQCVALFRQEWPEAILKQLSQCLNEVVSDYKSSSIHAEGVKNLLVWIAATCEEMDTCGYD